MKKAQIQTNRLDLASSEIQPKYFARHFSDEQRADKLSLWVLSLQKTVSTKPLMNGMMLGFCRK